MYARPKYELISQSLLNLTAANLPAQQTKISIPSTDPIEEILIVAQFTAATIAAGSWINHGILGILKKVGLYVSPPDGSYDALNVSGPGLLMLADQEGLRLDRSTQAARAAMNINYTLTGSIFRIAYRISFPHPQLVGQLRMRSLLDVQNHRADAILTLDWAAAAEICYNIADPIPAAANVEVFVGRREISRTSNEAILASGGFIRQDIRETSYPVAASVTTESRFAIPSPGEYATLVIAHQKGASNINRLGDLSANVTVGQETLWSLESGGNALMKFRMKDLQLYGDYNRVAIPPSLNATGNEALVTTIAGVTNGTALVTAKQIVSANEFGGPLANGCIIQEPAVVGIDFLSNGIADADDLSSLLNANFASDAIKWELVGNTTGPAAGTSIVNIIGRRFRSNVTPWKLQKAA